MCHWSQKALLITYSVENQVFWRIQQILLDSNRAIAGRPCLPLMAEHRVRLIKGSYRRAILAEVLFPPNSTAGAKYEGISLFELHLEHTE